MEVIQAIPEAAGSHLDTSRVRMVGTADAPEWVAADVCEVLGIKQARNVIRSFPTTARGVCTIHTLGGPQEMLTVTEAGLYRLIFKSRKQEAETVEVNHDHFQNLPVV